MKLHAKPTGALTSSVCPVCLKTIPARRLRKGDDIHLIKSCPEHGKFSVVVWRGRPDFNGWQRPKTASHPLVTATVAEKGCPHDCGLCPEHRQRTCCVLLEVTQRCNLECPTCYASSTAAMRPDPDLVQIEGWYRALLATNDHANIQLSGGEPCLRDELPEIIALGKSMGFTFFQLNTNGLRIAQQPAYLQRLVDEGLSTVFLQFDGISDDVYRVTRGRDLLEFKRRAISNCAELGLGVILVPTLIPGVNTHQIGDILFYALAESPAVRGVHFQPVSYFGRYAEAPTDEMRITLPEVISAIEEQTEGVFKAEHFRPPGAENALCSFHGSFVPMPGGKLMALSRHEPAPCCGTPSEDAGQGALRSRAYVAQNWSGQKPSPSACGCAGSEPDEWDALLQQITGSKFCVSGMAFQDCWTLDIDRLRDCHLHVMSPEGHLIPFCAYNLTSMSGAALYRH